LRSCFLLLCRIRNLLSGSVSHFQDAIDYNEWKFGERKESIAFAWRPLDVKLGSGLNLGIRNLTFIITGTASALNAISKYEGLNNAGYYEQAEIIAKGETFNGDIAQALQQITSGQLAGVGYLIIGTILVAFLAGFFILHFGFKIDEKMEIMIVDELEKRHKKDEEEISNPSKQSPEINSLSDNIQSNQTNI
ncbi:MAG: hypothetical protein WCR67_02170, partial [Bacilli bacterium]